MKKSDTFLSFQNLSHAVRRCHNNCRQVRTDITNHVYASPKTVGKRQVDFAGAVEDCM